MNKKIIIIIAVILFIGIGIGSFLVGRNSGFKDSAKANMEIIERYEKEAELLQIEVDSLYVQLGLLAKNDDKIKQDEKEIVKKHRENRRTGVYDGTIAERIKSIRDRGRRLFDHQ